MQAQWAIFFVAVCNLVLGLVVLLKNRASMTNVSFSIFTFLLAVWMPITYYSNNIALSHEQLLWLNRITVFIPAVALYFLLLFSLLFTRFVYKYLRTLGVFLGITSLIVSLIATTPLFIKEIYPQDNIVAISYGVFTPVFSFFIVAEFLTIITILTVSTRRLNGAAKARTQIMTSSLFLAIALLVVTNLVLPVGFNNYGYILIGLLSTFIIVGGFTYAIIKHRLFDIRSVVARSVAYILLLVTLGSTYAFITFYVGNVLFSRTKISVPQQTFNVISALLLAFTFQPLQRFFEKVTDKIFYREHYDPENLLNQISHILATEIGLEELSRKVRSLLTKQLRVDNVDIVVLNNNQVFSESGHYVVSRLEELAQDLGQVHGKVIIADEELDGRRKKILLKYGVGVMANLRTKKEKRIGYLLFGPKLSGDIFTSTDVKVISTIADQLAIAIQNAKAYVEIQRFNQTLRSKVTVATQELREANANLKQIDVVKDDFLSMASHQLRTPLTVIEGYISNILDNNYGELTPKQREAIELTQVRLRMARGLVIDLLNISRMEAGRFFIDLQAVDLNKVVETELYNLKLIASEQKTKIVYKPPEKPVPILSLDEQKIRQVVMNLVENALQYAPKGIVTVSLQETNKQVEFLVKDNGIGVPKVQQLNLFNKFFRADNAKRTRPDGTGIGLFLVKKIVETHGGHVIFESVEKKGSTFGFSLSSTPIVKPLDKPIEEPKELLATKA